MKNTLTSVLGFDQNVNKLTEDGILIKLENEEYIKMFLTVTTAFIVGTLAYFAIKKAFKA